VEIFLREPGDAVPDIAPEALTVNVVVSVPATLATWPR